MKTKKCRPVLVEIKGFPKENEYSCLLGDSGKLYMPQAYTSSFKPQQLILISLEDEKIEVGESYYDSHNNLVLIAITQSDHDIYQHKKVIATQDQISPEYIAKFVEQYNNGKVEDMEIEMMYKECPNSSIKNWNYFPEPLLTNGFITIV